MRVRRGQVARAGAARVVIGAIGVVTAACRGQLLGRPCADALTATTLVALSVGWPRRPARRR